jgi:pimeloyl-ACP methyl ester carboxylesterase
MPTDNRFRTPEGLELHYVDYGGDGPPLILLHGLTGYARSWDETAAAMTATHHVYALDQRGHGDSDHTPDYSVQSFGRDVAHFAAHLGLQKYALCGLSLGARNAIPVGAEDGARLTHLVLVDMAPEMARTGAKRVRTNIGGQVDLAAGFMDEDDAYAFAISQAERPGDPRVQARTRAGLQFALQAGEDGRLRYKYDPLLFQITGRSAIAEQPYLWECLERTPCPTLVVRGETSDILSPELVDRMLKKLPKGRAVTIEGAGHPVPYDQPERFVAALKAFLATG